MKFYRHKFNLSLALALLVVVLSSCGGGESKKSEASAEFNEASSQVVSDINKVIKDLPPPSEVPYLLMATGSDYNPTLVNPLASVDEYVNASVKSALNLGIYTTDIGYLTSYEKAQESLEYISACQKLAEAIGVASALDLELIGRFERNLSNRDSLKNIVDEVMANTGEHLEGLDRMHMAGLVLSGSFLEGLYISTAVIDTYPDDLPEETKNLILEPLIKIVIDQEEALDDLIQVMNDLGNDEAVAETAKNLAALKKIYVDELEPVKTEISNNTGGLVLKSSVLKTLTEEVARIRGTIVG
ncbi:MAG: hypothetical protein KI790_17900 [Cyclobacteriaceae bacterium]|nr:hypothetical protein [Cyclobacteriaceae bacterium HetDA_MAG_MS6]